MLVKRETRTGSNSLNVVYRPYTVDELLGNQLNKNRLKNDLDRQKLPHTLLFQGESGCGKTTAARIVALGLNCEAVDKSTSNPCLKCSSCKSILEGHSMDVQEINVGKDGGKSTVADVISTLDWAPFNSRYKVIIFDEAHKLTTDAKDLLLKPTEDGYKHVYFIFCTNQPAALKSKKTGGDAFLGRCTKLNFHPLQEYEIADLLVNVLEFEGESYNKEALKLIISETKGVPRDALVSLNDVISEGSWSIDAVKSILGNLVDDNDSNIIELSRALIQGTWKKSCKLYEKLSKIYSPESLRIAISGYFTACLKKATKVTDGRMYSKVLDTLATPIYVTGKVADHLFYNMMFKIIDIITKNKKGV